MELKRRREIELPVPSQRAWNLISEVEQVVACVPGAQVTANLGSDRYEGKLNIRIGPVAAHFSGVIAIKEIDIERQKIVVVGEGKDAGTGSKAALELAATVIARQGHECVIIGEAIVLVTGKLATQAGRMLGPISDQILDQFDENLRAYVIREPDRAGKGSFAAEGDAEQIFVQRQEFNVLRAVVSAMKNAILKWLWKLIGGRREGRK